MGSGSAQISDAAAAPPGDRLKWRVLVKTGVKSQHSILSKRLEGVNIKPFGSGDYGGWRRIFPFAANIDLSA
jgi:hypothetical protein